MSLSRNGSTWATQSQSSTPGSQRTNLQRVRTSSPWRRWNPPLENSRTSSSKRRSWLKDCKLVRDLHYSTMLHYSFYLPEFASHTCEKAKSRTRTDRTKINHRKGNVTLCCHFYEADMIKSDFKEEAEKVITTNRLIKI